MSTYSRSQIDTHDLSHCLVTVAFTSNVANDHSPQITAPILLRAQRLARLPTDDLVGFPKCSH